MIIGILKLELFFPTPNSLKSKRIFLKKVISTLRAKFNISVSEVEFHDKWQRTVLGISIVGIEKRYINSVIDKIIDTIDLIHEVELIKQEFEII
jgi:uncharacterized protein